jgi:hypothetical protein
VRREGAVLQHGSILLTRLPFDETDLLRPRPGSAPTTRNRLRAATVTLGELGAPTEPRVVADALIEGFATILDLSFTLTVDVHWSKRLGATVREAVSTARGG